MRPTLALATLAAAAATAVAPVHASPVGRDCSLVTDVRDLRADVASFFVVGGPVAVAETGVTSVTVRCVVLVDGAEHTVVAATRAGHVGFVRGHTTVGTFSGPTIGVCTEVTWTGGSNGRASDCPAS